VAGVRPDNVIMSKPKFVVELEQGDLLPLDRAKGVRVSCVEGSLWLTEERAAADIVLQPGQSYEVEAAGRTLVQAMSRSRVAVEALGGRPALAFSTFPQVQAA
jgi:ferric-dicitrate binding protein FerR (iron transport regulator)